MEKRNHVSSRPPCICIYREDHVEKIVFRFMRIKQKNALTLKIYFLTSHMQITPKLF